jgi:hypothetical protein
LAAWLLLSDCFTARIWRHVLVLIAGAILSPGRRTVAAALRVVGLEQEASFTNYHRVLNRNSWSSRRIAGRLLRLSVSTFLFLMARSSSVSMIPLSDRGEVKSGRVACTEIRYAPRMATSSKPAGCGGLA